MQGIPSTDGSRTGWCADNPAVHPA